jgi:predicted secreted Zn-dependent protease
MELVRVPCFLQTTTEIGGSLSHCPRNSIQVTSFVLDWERASLGNETACVSLSV